MEVSLFTLGVLTAISDAGQFKTAFEEAQAENVKLAGGSPAAAEDAPTADAPAAEPETKAEEKTEEAAAEEKKEE